MSEQRRRKEQGNKRTCTWHRARKEGPVQRKMALPHGREEREEERSWTVHLKAFVLGREWHVSDVDTRRTDRGGASMSRTAARYHSERRKEKKPVKEGGILERRTKGVGVLGYRTGLSSTWIVGFPSPESAERSSTPVSIRESSSSKVTATTTATSPASLPLKCVGGRGSKQGSNPKSATKRGCCGTVGCSTRTRRRI